MKKHPRAFWVDFGDFSWFQMDMITDIRFVGGFVRAGSITPEQTLWQSRIPYPPLGVT